MPARLDLNEFQQQLARRLASPEALSLSAHWLAIEDRGRHLLLPLTHAGEIFPPAPVQRLPYVKDWVLGVAPLRGGLYTVIDLLRHLDPAVAPAAPGPSSHFVSFSPSLGVNAVWPVQRLLGLRAAADFVAPAQDGAGGAWRQTLRDAQGQDWQELDLRHVVAQADFLDIHARAVAPANPH